MNADLEKRFAVIERELGDIQTRLGRLERAAAATEAKPEKLTAAKVVGSKKEKEVAA